MEQQPESETSGLDVINLEGSVTLWVDVDVHLGDQWREEVQQELAVQLESLAWELDLHTFSAHRGSERVAVTEGPCEDLILDIDEDGGEGEVPQ